MTDLRRSAAASPGRAGAILVFLFIAANLLTHCWFASRVKPFWMDEMLVYTVITDPSLFHAITTLSHGGDGGFPLYYLAGWSMAHLAAPTEFPLRLVSCLFEIAAFTLLWRMLRRTYGWLPALLTVAICMGGSTLMLYQNSELRFYSLMFLGATVATIGYDTLYRQAVAGERPTLGALALNAAGHAMMVLTHPFGVFYSFVIGGSALLAFLWKRPKGFALPYLLSTGCGEAVFLLWLRSFIEQSGLIPGRGALPVPSAPDFLRIYLQVAPTLFYDDRTKTWLAQHKTAAALGLLAVIIALAAAAWVVRSLLAREPAQTQASSSETVRPFNDAHLFILAVVMLLVPALIWVTSHLGKSLFLHRYFISSVVGFAILYARGFAELGRLIVRRGGRQALAPGDSRRPIARVIAAGAAAAFAAVYVLWPLAAVCTAPDGFIPLRERIANLAKPGVPVVPAITNDFWQSVHYGGPNNPCWFILDHDVAADPNNGLAGYTEFVSAGALKAGNPQLPIISTEDFLKRFPRFVVEQADRSLWYPKRVGQDPAYRSEPIPGNPEGDRMVTRVEGGGVSAR